MTTARSLTPELLLSAQYAITSILGGVEDADEALREVLGALGKYLGFDAGTLWLIEDDLLCRRAQWPPAERALNPGGAEQPRTFGPAEGLPGRVWSSGETLASEDQHSSSGFAFPLSRGNQIIGVIEYRSTHPRPFCSDLRQAFTAAAGQLSQYLSRMQAQNALSTSEAEHHVLFENSNDAFGISVDEHFVYVNRAYAAMFGFDHPDQVVGVSIYDTLPPAQWEVVREHRKRRLAGLPEPMQYHSRGRRVDGSDFPTEVRATDYWIDGRMYTLVILRDISAERQAQEILSASNAALRRANADLEQFAYAASHDLQEPLRVISLYSELLRRRHQNALSDDGKELLETVTAASRRINQLVKDLLSYTQTASLSDMPEAPVDTNDVLAEIQANLRHPIESTKARVTIDPLPAVYAHRTHLVQLFQNLVSNGLKYRKPDRPPQIHVSSRRRDGMVEFLVRDDGIGIPPEYHERIFGVFKRLHSQRVPGTGIGLAICRKIVDHYGGAIWVQSEAGEGATFHLTLPAVIEEQRP